MSQFNYTINPQSLLDLKNLRTKKSGKVIGIEYCPNCGGGNSRQIYTAAVHLIDGNFWCMRTKCSWKGNFWQLLEYFNLNPYEYIDRHEYKKSSPTARRKSNYVYKRSQCK